MQRTKAILLYNNYEKKTAVMGGNNSWRARAEVSYPTELFIHPSVITGITKLLPRRGSVCQFDHLRWLGVIFRTEGETAQEAQGDGINALSNAIGQMGLTSVRVAGMEVSPQLGLATADGELPFPEDNIVPIRQNTS